MSNTMHEILFRGKRIDNGEWVKGAYGNHTPFDAMIMDSPYLTINGGLSALNFWVVDPTTVGQYTGLTDKNGTKIFEGDIVKTLETDSNSEQRCFLVVQSHGAFWLYDEFLDSKLDFLGSYYKEALEIIGNIYDNPESFEGSIE